MLTSRITPRGRIFESNEKTACRPADVSVTVQLVCAVGFALAGQAAETRSTSTPSVGRTLRSRVDPRASLDICHSSAARRRALPRPAGMFQGERNGGPPKPRIVNPGLLRNRKTIQRRLFVDANDRASSEETS
jgi:hypothetical protein